MLLLLTLLASATPSCRAHCPACPRPAKPLPVTVIAEPLACQLPELPMGLPEAVGFPSPDGQSIFVSVSDWATLSDYALGLNAWIWAAAECMTGAPK